MFSYFIPQLHSNGCKSLLHCSCAFCSHLFCDSADIYFLRMQSWKRLLVAVFCGRESTRTICKAPLFHPVRIFIFRRPLYRRSKDTKTVPNSMLHAQGMLIRFMKACMD